MTLLFTLGARAGYVAPPQAEVEWNPEWGCGADVRCEEIIYGTGTATGGKGGVAPRIESCVSSFGCMKCVLLQPYWTPACGTASGESGSCTCKLDSTAGEGCKLEGSCTYRR